MKVITILTIFFPFFHLNAAYKVYICKFNNIEYEINHEIQSKKLEHEYKNTFLMYYSNKNQWFYKQAKEEIPNFESWSKENKYNYEKKNSKIIGLQKQFRSNLKLNLNSKNNNIPQNIDYSSKYELDLNTNEISLTNKILLKYQYYEKIFNTIYTGKCCIR